MTKFRLINIVFVGLLILTLIFTSSYTKIIIVVLLPLIWLALTTIGSFHIRWNYFTKSIHYEKTNDKVIAITFDDGPTQYTDQVLEILEKNHAKASFFLIGQNAEKNPEKVKKIIEKGHIIGNHTQTHSNQIGFFNSKKILHEIEACNKVIFKICEKKLNLFRPPFGVTNPNIAKGIKNTDMQTIGWNIRSLDTKIKDEEELYQRINKRIKPGSIILLHDTSQHTINVLERLLRRLHELNYITVTLEELLKIKAYAN